MLNTVLTTQAGSKLSCVPFTVKTMIANIFVSGLQIFADLWAN